MDILGNYGEASDGVDLGDVVACYSKGDLGLERIRVVVEGNHMDVVACDSLGDQVGMVMVRDEMGDLDRPCACAEVADFESG